MNKFFTDDKAPFLFTLLIGLATFQLNNMVSYVADTPMVAYRFKSTSKADTGDVTTEQLEMRIENINRKISFNNLIFDLKYRAAIQDTPAQVYDPELIAVAPSKILPDTVVDSRHQLINRYQIANLQPGALYLAKLKVRHNKNINELPKVYLNCSNTVFLTKDNLETWVVRNQFFINFIFLCLWIVLIGIYTIKMLLNNKHHANAK
jgi:hypothetical protein